MSDRVLHRNGFCAIELSESLVDIVERRNALAEALSAHDLERVRSFLHPSYVVRGADGVVVLDYPGFVDRLATFFSQHPEYRQSVQVEESRTEEDSAMLVTRHVEVLRTWRRQHEIPSRWNETWRKVGDQWLLLEERPHPAGP